MGEKKGQFYLFTAVVLCSLVFFMLIDKNTYAGSVDPIDALYENYVDEIPMVLNSAEYNGYNTTLQMENYTLDFLEYAKSKNIDLGILYAIVFDEGVRIVNYLNEPVYFMMEGVNNDYVESYSSAYLDARRNFTIRLNDTTYHFNESIGDGLDFKVLVKKVTV